MEKIELSKDLPVQVRLAIARNTMAQYKEKLFALEIDSTVARYTKNDELKHAVQVRMKDIVGGVEVIKAILDGLEEELGNYE